jgi:PEP-CTERM motif
LWGRGLRIRAVLLLCPSPVRLVATPKGKLVMAQFRNSRTVMHTKISTIILCLAALAIPASADSFFFSTGNPDGKIATLSRPLNGSSIQTETADDFVLGQSTLLTSATFTGLLPTGSPVSNITQVEIEFYHVFPADSANPPSGNVPTRVNSPGDVEIASATRDSAAGTLSFSAAVLNSSFSVANTVVTGINKVPNEFTGGEGPATGEEVQVTVNFTTPVVLPADHYFFRPEALLSSGNFLYLSAPKPIVAPGTPFSADLQSWIRNDDLAPDWLRIGTDITHQGPFNAAFSLTGNTVPEPSTWALIGVALGLLGFKARKSVRR